MKAEEFDRRFDAGEDITEALDLTKARRPKQELKRGKTDAVGRLLELSRNCASGRGDSRWTRDKLHDR